MGYTTPLACAPGIVDVGGGGGGAIFLKPFFRSSPNPCRFFSSPITFKEGLPDWDGGKISASFPMVFERGIAVKVAILTGRCLALGGVSGT